MGRTLSATTRRRLNVQGLCDVDDETLAAVILGQPKRRAQTRFACGVGAVWLVATALAFQSGALIVGYSLGVALTGSAVLVSTTDICIPSMIYNVLFGRLQAR